MALENPKCTAFCTGGRDDIKGHPRVSEEEIARIAGELAATGLRFEPSKAAVDALYRRGHGYHAIADTLGISHQEAFTILTGMPPSFAWNAPEGDG